MGDMAVTGGEGMMYSQLLMGLCDWKRGGLAGSRPQCFLDHQRLMVRRSSGSDIPLCACINWKTISLPVPAGAQLGPIIIKGQR